jgi:hypothetical protein
MILKLKLNMVCVYTHTQLKNVVDEVRLCNDEAVMLGSLYVYISFSI